MSPPVAVFYYFWDKVTLVEQYEDGWCTCEHGDGRVWRHWFGDLRKEPRPKRWLELSVTRNR